MRYRTFRPVLVLIILILAIQSAPLPIHAQRRGMPAVPCAIITTRIVCYEAQDATPHPVTPSDQRALDFAVAPDGNWVVYRVSDAVTIAPIYENTAPLQIDPKAVPPAAIDFTRATMAWSPDGMAIAYVTANGFRITFPTESGTPQIVEVTDRLAVNLRFSPGGAKLAVQADDESWSVFAVQSTGDGGAIRRTRTIDQAADVAWLDDNKLVVAPVIGGLFQVEATNANTPPAWNTPAEHFNKLIATSSGDVLALHPDPGDTVGEAVRISADGRVTPLGNSKIDSQAEWGPDGNMLYYITSGTPILINRATGDEDTLPLQRVTRMIWSPPLPPLVSSLQLDADLYFLAPDVVRIQQVKRLGRGGLDSVEQVTHQFTNVRDFAISPDRSRVAVVVGNQIGIDPGAEGGDFRPLGTVKNAMSGHMAWRPDGQQIAYIDGTDVYLVAADGNSIPTPIHVSVEGGGPAIYNHPQFSPDGKYLALESGGAQPTFVVINLANGASTAVSSAQGALPWQPDDFLLGQIVARSGWRVSGARITPDKSILLLRRVGWRAGPQIVQLYSMSPDGSQATVRSRLNILTDSWLSPTGRYAAGLQRTGKINQLVILDLQTGRIVRVQDAEDMQSILWVS